jgi:hypothetical protein
MTNPTPPLRICNSTFCKQPATAIVEINRRPRVFYCLNHAAALVTGAMIKGDEVTYRPAVSAGPGLELGADVTGDE